jgi:branched-chain amino acid transport system substrate-binding protein
VGRGVAATSFLLNDPAVKRSAVIDAFVHLFHRLAKVARDQGAGVKRQGWLLAILCWLGLGIASVAPGMAADDIVIGGGLTLSGAAAAYGEDGRTGADIAVADINAKGGIFGRKLRVDYDDTGMERARAVAIYRKYAARPDIVAMLSISSVELVALDPLANEVKLPILSIGSAATFAKFSPYTFRLQVIVGKAMPTVLTQVKAAKGLKTVSILYDVKNNFTVSEMEAVKAAAPAVGLKLLGIESFTTGDQDFALQLTRIAEQNPDLFYLAATTDEAALAISQARELGIKAQILGGAGLNDPRIGSLAKAGAYGTITFAPFSPKDDRPMVKAFVAEYQAKFAKAEPPAYVALGYDAVMLLADAIRRAGITDREAVRNALGTTKALEGLNGLYSYDVSGDNVRQEPRLLVYGPNGYDSAK